jgi:hypothetical protein
MVDAVILQEWISKAEDDFQFARISITNATNSTNQTNPTFLYQSVDAVRPQCTLNVIKP